MPLPPHSFVCPLIGSPISAISCFWLDSFRFTRTLFVCLFSCFICLVSFPINTHRFPHPVYASTLFSTYHFPSPSPALSAIYLILLGSSPARACVHYNLVPNPASPVHLRTQVGSGSSPSLCPENSIHAIWTHTVSALYGPTSLRNCPQFFHWRATPLPRSSHLPILSTHAISLIIPSHFKCDNLVSLAPDSYSRCRDADTSNSREVFKLEATHHDGPKLGHNFFFLVRKFFFLPRLLCSGFTQRAQRRGM